jgi:hypothetical protein
VRVFRILTVDLFTGSAGALARISHRGERLGRKFLSFETSVCRRDAGEGARAPSESVQRSIGLEFKRSAQ